MTGQLRSRIEKLEAKASPDDRGNPWRQVILEPGEPEPEPVEGENLMIWRIVDPPRRRE